ncbi:MarR family transcriptional regulator [Uliginosibacterium sediminicola]|uniref:MarR family transcriptional regulator n=1 Tax=Uliginosibacterium sediminicola TaxID=2024550 RepID=A0ABU9YWB7_9RHOO
MNQRNATSLSSSLPSAAPAALDESALRLDKQLCFALYSSSLAMTKLYKPLLAKLGLTYPQYLVMLVLWEEDGVTVSALGERLFLDSGTLTPLLKRIEAQGFLRRARSAEDERQVIVSLTQAGRDLRTTAVQVPYAVACASACSLEQIQALTTELHALRSNLIAGRSD